jgi:hypothetical protein
MGRVIKAELVALADGEHAVEAEVEVFEPGPLPPLDVSRAIPSRDLPGDALLLTIDRTFSLPEFEEAVSGIATLFGRQPQYEVKKALDPIAVLGIGVGVLAVGRRCDQMQLVANAIQAGDDSRAAAAARVAGRLA